MRLTFIQLAVFVPMSTFVSCSSSDLKVQGVVTVDGAAVDEGTIQLRPAIDVNSHGVGGAIKKGVILCGASQGLSPGKYLVTVTAFKKTGRTINDAMLGKVEETEQLKLANPVQEMELTDENSSDLKFAVFTAGAKHDSR